MNTLTYKGTIAQVGFNPEDGIFVGHIAGINDIVGFHADSVTGLIAAFHEAVDDYKETCRCTGKPPEKPYSGKLMLRVGPETHASAALAAEISGKSLNQSGEEALRQQAARDLSRA